MAAPTVTARQVPVGIPYKDGFPTTIAFALDPDISFWEISVTPPAIEGGDPIDQTTMHNTTWRTQAPRSLASLEELSLTVAYDERCYDQILAILNENGAITVHFPDGATLAFYGYLKRFEPQENQEGERPTANITITPTNWDPDNNVEEGPVLTAAAGT